jgi:hypothetical protein
MAHMAERLTCVLGLALAVTGCATVPLASAEDDARMKSFEVPPDAALVYLYRNEFFGNGVHMDVSLDGYPSGQTVWGTFMVWEVWPGHHRLLSQAENDAELDIVVAPGQRYFVWQEVKMGVLYARSRLHLVSEYEGRKGLRDCKLVRMRLPRPRPTQPMAPPVRPPAGPDSVAPTPSS